MNVMTRGEKIDRFIENAKHALVTTLLVAWAVVTFWMGIILIADTYTIKDLKEELKTYQSIVKEETENGEWILVVDDVTGEIIYSNAR